MQSERVPVVAHEDDHRVVERTDIAQRVNDAREALVDAEQHLQAIAHVRKHYRIDDDAWYEAIMRRNDALVRWEEALAEGVEMVGAGGPAGKRLEESREFFAFLHDEAAGMMARWRQRRGSHVG